jgi:tetratricopeptide (TPR) repeat protein
MRAFFRRERSRASGLKRTFCAACAPYAPTQLEVATYFNGFFMTSAGLLILAFSGRGAERLGYIFLFFGLVAVFNLVTSVAHEVGHAALARAVGMRIVAITIGSGPILISKRRRNMRIELRRFLLAGGRTLVYHQISRPGKWRHALMLAGGILGNMALVALVGSLLALLFPARSWMTFAVVFAGYAVIAGQVLSILINLFPRNSRAGPSDGKQLIKLVMSKDFHHQQLANRIILEGMALLENEQYQEALAHLERGCEALPTNGGLLSLLIHTAGKAGGPRVAVEYYRDRAHLLTAGTDADRAGAVWASVNAAWHALLCADMESLSLADQLSQRAVEALPDVPTIQAVRGALLIDLGDHEAGLALLMPAIRRIEGRDDRLCFVPFLAKGERARGDFDMALEFERFGDHLTKAA